LHPFDRFTNNNEMSNDMSNNLTNDNGTPNLSNPRVLAAFIDGVGILLSPLAMRLRNDSSDTQMEAEDVANILVVYRTLMEMRNATGQDADWFNESQHELIPAVLDDGRAKHKARTDAVIQAMLAAGVPIDLLPPEFRPKASPAEAADAIFNQLRADGIVG